MRVTTTAETKFGINDWMPEWVKRFADLIVSAAVEPSHTTVTHWLHIRRLFEVFPSRVADSSYSFVGSHKQSKGVHPFP